jgi:hypothetical protein
LFEAVVASFSVIAIGHDSGTTERRSFHDKVKTEDGYDYIGLNEQSDGRTRPETDEVFPWDLFFAVASQLTT